MHRPQPTSTLFPYTTLFRSYSIAATLTRQLLRTQSNGPYYRSHHDLDIAIYRCRTLRSEEHTSELQSHVNLVCRLLLEKKNIKRKIDKHLHIILIKHIEYVL